MIRVLLVDDQNMIRQMLQLSLEPEKDIEIVGSAGDGQTALREIEKHHPDVALIDIEMPGIDGLTIMQIISKHFAETKVLILSSYDKQQYINNALLSGAKGYLLKGTPIDEIANAIRSVYKGYVQLGPGVFEKYAGNDRSLHPHGRDVSLCYTSSLLEKRSQHQAIANAAPSMPTSDWHSAAHSQAEERLKSNNGSHNGNQPPTTQRQLSEVDRDSWSASTKELLDTLPQVWTRGLLYFLVVFVALALPWAMLSKVDVTSSAKGRLEPKGETTRLDAPVNGVVGAIKVREGQQVKAGQRIVELKSDIERAQLQEAQARLKGFADKLTQLKLLKNQLQMSARTQRKQNRAQASEQLELINQTQQKINFNKTAIASAKELVAKDREVVKRYRDLRQKGVVSGYQLDEAERQLIQNRQNLRQAQSELEQNQTEFKKQQSARDKIVRQGELAIIEVEKQIKELNSQLDDTRSQIAQTQNQIKSLQYRQQQSAIDTPIDGTIFQLTVSHPGAVVQPGQAIARIAPKGTPLVLKAQISSKDSGFLRVGKPVKIKFDAYPYQDYGIVLGRISWISPDSKAASAQMDNAAPASQAQNQEEAFEMEIALDRDYIEAANKRIPLTPGQTATAEVIVRQRRLIDFLLDPFRKLQKGGLDL
ncbi:type I secretion membrane fusion protein, HlyD family [Pleurocapsa sp. PCC 7327]|uniref:HlyD family type I secretion periplasmic adaptor subunit n=1 Tax=Pleurocapsa sp. PCC 7327 TaxID=118163 RepID=UPI00029F95ED|nr:HlyD family type I secretion periplasmic adaptor subunit [Pleurocapsa sp. PCC 7327]AFY78106.1 type I secretion membrane fusion protein, HlyD family [Pleurocapsa sp. PCC 7327]